MNYCNSVRKFSRNGYDIYIYRATDVGLFAIIAIDQSGAKPAIGGYRCISYENKNLAIADVIKIAKAMTLKTAISRMPFGGGKAVIMKPKCIPNRKKFF
ncbi:MAG: Glu/Leu/Phe/Val dehydrogenase dimerization domain-containing protein [Gammaproteobacteria bacterium]